MGYTFISGATGGLGRAFVFCCANCGENLFLTGRTEEKLRSLKEEVLSLYPTLKVEIFACRLDREEERKELFEEIEERELTFSKVIHAAGADIQKGFMEYTQEKILFQTRINLEANVSLTRFFLSRADSDLKILAISSVSGIYPMPYFALYSATKGAVTSFYTALHEELKGQGIAVTCVLPGAMPTREDIKEQIRGQGLWGKLAAKSPEFVAKRSLKALEKNKRTYIPGFFNNVMNVGTKLIPLPLKLKFIAGRWSKITKDAFS